MGNLLTLLIVLIFIFRGISRLLGNAGKEEKTEEAHPEEWKRHFESMGIPAVEKEVSPLPFIPPESEKTAVESASFANAPPEFSEVETPKRRILSLDKVREGIILSEILGPPRAKLHTKNKPAIFTK